MGMGHREPMHGGAEFDAFTGWRRVLRKVAGKFKGIKQRFSRRVRRHAREETRAEADGYDAGLARYDEWAAKEPPRCACGAPSTWRYDPRPDECACDACVPRGCSCWPEEDDPDRVQPCVEWIEILGGAS